MGLRAKTYLVIGLIVSIASILLYITATYILSRSIAEIEGFETRQSIQRAVDAIKLESDELSSNTRDYASWDDTYAFVQQPGQAYIDSNYILPTFLNLEIDVALITDDAARLVMARSFDRKNDIAVQPSDSILALIAPDSPLISISSINESVNGIVLLPEGPMLVSAWPIVTSQYTGPVRGTLIMGRYLDSDAVANLNELTHLSMSLAPYSGDTHFLSPPQLYQTDQGASIAVEKRDEQTTAGYTILKDVFGENAIEMQVLVDRSVYQQNSDFLHIFILFMVAVVFAIGLVIVWFISRLILSRLMEISRIVQEISGQQKLGTRVPVYGNDELSVLAADINSMLQSMEETQLNLQNQVQYLNTLLDNLSELFISYDQNGRIIYVNHRSLDFWGYEPDDLLGRYIYEMVDPAFKKELQILAEMHLDQGPVTDLEIPVLHKNGTPMLVRINASLILMDGQAAGGLILAEDITLRKKAVEHLVYVSNHDSLTGVFNRTYYENYLKEISASGDCSIGIIVCDLDGLKFINDTLGHSAGDQVLIKAAKVLQKCIPENGIMARIGGDEFALVLPCLLPDDTEKTCSIIRETMADYNKMNPQIPLVMSIGSSVQNYPGEILTDVYRRADNFMYREKLHSQRSNRASIVTALTSAMEARDFATSGHEERLQDIVVALGNTLGLPRERLRDLRLLARFHDIGKVGIPDRVLFKPGRLTPEETDIMQQHSEIGHRIALAVPELIPIAGWILEHHEWWNGAGYPNGTRGEDIPLECRILAIADAYDAMISDRPYRQAMSHEDALAELKRCAGLQFDPHLVNQFVNLYDSDEESA